MFDAIWQFFLESWHWILLVVERCASLGVTVHALLHKRDSRSAAGWAGVAWLVPVLGSLLYLALGINRIQRKGGAMRLREAWQPKHEVPLGPDDRLHADEVTKMFPNLVGLAHLGHRLTGRPLLPGNAVEPLFNGDEAFPAMLAAIDAAGRSVALSTYIFDMDRAGEEFCAALGRARGRGVEVRVLVDDIGSRYSRVNAVEKLKEAGVNAAAFLPTRMVRLFRYANLRCHRKLLVADGRVGFTGGTNIREGHCLGWAPKEPVRCLHFRLEGPVVLQLQEAFAVDWAFTTGESLRDERWFPGPVRVGEVWARGIADGPDEDMDAMPLVLLGALASATRRVRVVTPYFLPDPALIAALNATALRGVRVDVVLPSENNIALAHWASRAVWWQILERGCRVHLSPPPFDHTKLMIVDDVWTLFGSTNWDPRSLRLNFEFNVECYDERLAAALARRVDEKIASSHEVTLEEARSFGFLSRVRDGAARLLSPYL